MKIEEVIESLKDCKNLVKEFAQFRHPQMDRGYFGETDLNNALAYAIGVLGKVKEEKDIRGIICHFGQLTSKYPDKRHLIAGDNTFISSSQYEDLAAAIVEELTSWEGK
jgi:hypothetical protein